VLAVAKIAVTEDPWMPLEKLLERPNVVIPALVAGIQPSNKGRSQPIDGSRAQGPG
jgi:hypothetical protein